MTNAGLNGFNINRLGVAQRGINTIANGNNRNGVIFGNVGDVFSAVIAQKNPQTTQLALADGRNFSVNAEISGNIGDEVFFEIGKNEEGATTLKQVFPSVDGQNFVSKHISLQNLQELMIQNDYAKPTSSFLDVEGITQEKLDARQAANEAANRIKRNINRISANVHSTAAAQLAAEGINVDKMPIDTLNSVVSQLDAAQTNNQTRVYDELSQKIANISDLNNGQIAQVLSNDAELTLDNLYTYKYSGAIATEGYISQEQWQQLQKDITRFLNENGFDINDENMARVRLLLESQIPLNNENFDKLVFLQDMDGNVDIKAILPQALALDAKGTPIGELNIYDAQKEALKIAETRLAMSYEANTSLIGTDLEMDLDLQIEAVKALKELAADTSENVQKLTETIQSIKTLPQTNFASIAAVVHNAINFTPIALNNHTATLQYEQNATMASLKYGDNFAKIAEQFAPLLRSMGFADDTPTIRAAKILTANNMDINAENLAKIKDMDAKIEDVQTKLHPRIAAQMVADGLTPANMHMDDILAYIEQFKNQFGKSDTQQLLENIAQMDRSGDVAPEVRAQVIQIYQMLHKVTKNSGAGIGFAVNAGIDLTLENLMDFAKNFDTTKARNNTINYAAVDGVYLAKHLVTSFAENAKPAPLAAFVSTQSLQDPLTQSVEKLQNIAKDMATDEQLNIERVNNAVKELSTTGKEAIRSLVSMGMPVTLSNIRQFKALKDKNLEKEITELDNDTASKILATLPTTDDKNINAIEAANNLQQATDTAMDKAIENADTQKISQLDIILQQLNFRDMLLANSHNHSFAMNFNNRLADVKMHVLSNEMDVEKGVTTYLSLNTAMGEIEGLIKIKGDDVKITIAADTAIINFLKQNDTDTNINFVQKKAFKNLLSTEQNQPIY
ncbi:MAG: DUF6240 domain-containing protein [Defluviitaleaceae bacterium]|nr:DUF6240 domain-containing protein [Defluviitaleaceae bacterium]